MSQEGGRSLESRGDLRTPSIASTVFVLALFLGFCIIFGFPKLRSTLGHRSMVVKSLEETVGQGAFVRYMTPDTPRGPIDVLKTPELLERAQQVA